MTSALARLLRYRIFRIEFAGLAALGLVAALIATFFVLAGEVRNGDTVSFDESVLLAFRVPGDPADPIGSRRAEEMVRDLTSLGGIAILGPLTLAAAVLLWLLGRHRDVMALLAATLGGQLFSRLAKGLIDRPRPDLVPHDAYVTSASFPSGHAMMAAVTYLTLAAMISRHQPGRAIRVYLMSLAVLLTVTVGASRVYLGVHWPTDVLAGWAVGAAWAMACLIVADLFDHARKSGGTDVRSTPRP